jgi:hypothetical protein
MQGKAVSVKKRLSINSLATLALLIGLAPLTVAQADSGFYVGGSIGSASIDVSVPDSDIGAFDFDESDTGYKVFLGYNIDLAVFDLAIEGGYVDLGAPSGNVLGMPVGLDITGLDAFLLAGFELGPIGIFGKAGVITWDVDAKIDRMNAGGDDGTDPAYGVGLRFSIASFEIRAEYEIFDLESTKDVHMASIGFAVTF